MKDQSERVRPLRFSVIYGQRLWCTACIGKGKKINRRGLLGGGVCVCVGGCVDAALLGLGSNPQIKRGTGAGGRARGRPGEGRLGPRRGRRPAVPTPEGFRSAPRGLRRVPRGARLCLGGDARARSRRPRAPSEAPPAGR